MNNKQLILIVAYAKNRVIGNHGKIPWHIPGEQKRFKQLMLGNTVIMGRKTYEEIGHPLPGRKTIVLSQTKNFTSENCQTAKSLQEAIALAHTEIVCIAGGAKVYAEALPLVECLYITEIEQEFVGDTFFPQWDESAYTCTMDAYNDGSIPYTYKTYTKNTY